MIGQLRGCVCSCCQPPRFFILTPSTHSSIYPILLPMLPTRSHPNSRCADEKRHNLSPFAQTIPHPKISSPSNLSALLLSTALLKLDRSGRLQGPGGGPNGEVFTEYLPIWRQFAIRTLCLRADAEFGKEFGIRASYPVSNLKPAPPVCQILVMSYLPKYEEMRVQGFAERAR